MLTRSDINKIAQDEVGKLYLVVAIGFGGALTVREVTTSVLIDPVGSNIQVTKPERFRLTKEVTATLKLTQ